MKTARIYEELAAYAREDGYARVTAAAVQDWRKRGMLPSARALGRRKRRPGRIPEPLCDRVLAVCRYRYDREVADLRIITLLLWLDGYEVDLVRVRAALPTARGLVERLVARVGSSARLADPEDQDADVDATSSVVARDVLGAGLGGEVVGPDALRSAAFDAIRLALGRGNPVDVEDLAPLAVTLGLSRAHTEAPAGSAPWLAGDPSAALADAVSALFNTLTSQSVAETSNDDLVRAREATRGLIRVFGAAGAIQIGFPSGFAGFGFLRLAQGLPEFPALLFYVAVLRPLPAAALASAFTPDELGEWMRASSAIQAWLEEHPEFEAGGEANGLAAVLPRWNTEQLDGADETPNE